MATWPIVLLILTAAPTLAAVRVHDHFEDGRIRPTLGCRAPHCFQVVSAPQHPVRAGTKALRVEIRKSDLYDEAGKGELKGRAEVRSFYQAGNQDAYWYGFSIYIPPSTSVAHAAGFLVHQTHPGAPTPDNARANAPAIWLAIRNGRWHIHRRDSATWGNTPIGGRDPGFTWDGPAVTKGRWVDWVFHVKQSNSTNGLRNGVIEVWMNGAQVFDKRNVMTMDRGVGLENQGVNGNYLAHKYGIYAAHLDESPAANYIVYIDEVKVGDAFAEVQPGGSVPPPPPPPPLSAPAAPMLSVKVIKGE